MTRLLTIAGVLLALALSRGVTAQEQKDGVAALIESMAANDYAGKTAVEKLVKIGKPAVPKLVTALKDKRRRVRYWSATACARIRDERAYAPLVAMAKGDKDAYCRATAIWYLQFFARPAVWQIAMDALKDPDATVRGYAILLLKQRNRTEAVPQLKEAMKHANYKTRYDAMVAVATLSDEDVTELLRGVLRGDESKDVRIGAMKCLTICRKKPAKIITVFIDGLEDRDEGVRAAAAMLLRKGTDQEFPFLPDGNVEDRKVAVANWRRWYQKHEKHLVWDEAKRRFEIRPPAE